MSNYSFNVSRDLEAVLEKLAKRKQSSKAEVLRRAISYYAYFDQIALENDGRGGPSSVVIVDGESKKEVVII